MLDQRSYGKSGLARPVRFPALVCVCLPFPSPYSIYCRAACLTPASSHLRISTTSHLTSSFTSSAFPNSHELPVEGTQDALLSFDSTPLSSLLPRLQHGDLFFMLLEGYVMILLPAVIDSLTSVRSQCAREMAYTSRHWQIASGRLWPTCCSISRM